MKNLLFIVVAFLLIAGCNQTPKKTAELKANNDFSFVFMTDIHLTKERHAVEGLTQAIDTINKLAPDFVLTGGDNIMDALAQSYERSDSAYSLFTETISKLNMPLYTTIGNHEVFGLYEKSGVDPSHELYAKKMYENRLHKRYYSFDHKNWHFIVLDAIGLTPDRNYYGLIDDEQINWLKNDLEQNGKERPVVVSTHIPLLSIGSQIMVDPTQGMSKGEIITNANDVRKILEQYNTKLVLQGHLHFLEDINYNGIHYITGGAVSSQWWQGQRFGMEEGFVEVHVNSDDFDWQYIDFGWEPKE